MTDSSPTDSAATTDHRSIGEVLTLLQADFPDVSISKIRFLESRGLVEPHRAPSGYRKFGDRDVARLRWILTMQRDHFLPLRVIKERLDSGEPLDRQSGESAQPGSPVENAPAGQSGQSSSSASAPASKPRTSRFSDPGPDAEALSPADLARLAGLSAQHLDQLINFGLLSSVDIGSGATFGRSELKVAQAAAGFLEHGIEPRHLKAWRVAAEREAGLLEQIVTPIGRKGSPEAARRAREVAEDLIDMGNTIREAIIVNALRDRLGLSVD